MIPQGKSAGSRRPAAVWSGSEECEPVDEKKEDKQEQKENAVVAKKPSKKQRIDLIAIEFVLLEC